jgi:hypothetical protein
LGTVLIWNILKLRRSFRYPRELVGARGFEPRTPCAQGRCATRLRYAPTVFIINEMRYVTLLPSTL